MRPAACRPASRLVSEAVKNTETYPSGLVSGWPTAPITSGAQPCMPAAPCGAADASTTRRRMSRRMSAISCATKLPIEAEQIDPLNADRLDEADGIVGHLQPCSASGRSWRRRRSYQYKHASIRGERVDERRVSCQVAAEVLQRTRYLSFTQVAVCVLDRVAGRDSPGRSVEESGPCSGSHLLFRGCHEGVLSW
jgi:hypothetical protein